MIESSEGAAAPAVVPDLVYILGPHAETCTELRYSLRSVAANLPHRKVWLIGTIPTWVQNVERITLHPLADKYANMRQSLRQALDHPGVTDEFILMNDDFFVMKPVTLPIPVFHLGPLADYLQFLGRRQNEWITSMRDTAEIVGGELCYETHTPLLFDRRKLRAVERDFPRTMTFTSTGCYHVAGAGDVGEYHEDTKVGDFDPDPTSPYWSTSDRSFARRPVGALIRRAFSEKCEYER